MKLTKKKKKKRNEDEDEESEAEKIDNNRFWILMVACTFRSVEFRKNEYSTLNSC